MWAAHNYSCLGDFRHALIDLGAAGQAEVNYFDVLFNAGAGSGQHKIARFDVSVDKAFVVSVVESGAGLAENIDYIRQWRPTLSQ